MKKYSWVFVGMLALFPVLLPAIFHPSAAHDILLHGSGVWTLFLLPLIIGPLFWFQRKADAISDPAQKKAFGAKVLTQAAPAMGIALFVLAAVLVVVKEQSLISIQRHGQRVTARVQDIYEGSCGKHSCSIDALYQFTPVNGSSPITGTTSLGSTSNRDDPRLVYAQQHGEIPIAYEIGNPANSAQNFDDNVFAVDHVHMMIRIIEILAAAIGIFVAVVECVVWNANRKQAVSVSVA